MGQLIESQLLVCAHPIRRVELSLRVPVSVVDFALGCLLSGSFLLCLWTLVLLPDHLPFGLTDLSEVDFVRKNSLVLVPLISVCFCLGLVNLDTLRQRWLRLFIAEIHV